MDLHKKIMQKMLLKGRESEDAEWKTTTHPLLQISNQCPCGLMQLINSSNHIKYANLHFIFHEKIIKFLNQIIVSNSF